jgi:two-component system, cell cycle sensor histidine kinase and response regulator CckA
VSDASFRAFFDASSDMIMVGGLDGRIVYQNPTLSMKLGYSASEIGTMHVLDLYPADRRPEAEALLAVMLGGAAASCHLPLQNKSGSLTPVETRIWRGTWMGEDCIFGISRDLTPEQTLLAKSSRLFNSNPAPMALTTVPEGRFVDVNEAFLKTLGYSREEVIGKTSAELRLFVRPEQREALAGPILTHRRFAHREVQVRRRDGAVLDGLFFGELIESHGLDRMLTVMVDQTERKRAEEELRTFSRLVEQSPVSVLVADPAWRIEYVNPKFCEVTGYSSAEVIGREPRILESGLTPPETYAEIERALSAGGVWRGEFCNRRKNGELFWEDGSICVIHDAEGRVTHLLAVKEDITARKQAEDVLHRTQEQFLQSQKLEAVGQLAGGVAHDFNNLLSVIRGYTEILMTRVPPEDATHGTLETIRQAADRAAGLTHQLLAFSRKQVLAPKVVDLGAVLADMGEMLRRLIGEDVELIVDRPAGLPPIKIDPGQFEQVVLNLAVNSRDAMPGGGTLRFELSEVQLDVHQARDGATILPGRYVLLSVSDTGCGMSPQVRARIFEPFYTTKERGRGSGLGLSTVYGIVKQSDGYVWADSEPGNGTTFRIYLPCVDAPLEQRAVPLRDVGGRGHGEVILIVEDDALVRGLAAEILSGWGYHVLVAPDADQAIRLAEGYSGPIDLVLTDVILPGMNGRELAERLTGSRPGLCVLFMSGYTDDVIARVSAGGRSGALPSGVKFVQKPFTLESLATGVRGALGSGVREVAPQ